MLPSELLLQNRYRIDRLVGQGGMGAVYAAHDLRLGHTVAIKQVLRGDAGGFVREAQLLARLRHHALPKVTDFFVEEAGQFLVMDYVPGENLETILAQRQTPFPRELVMEWADQLLVAVSYLHSQHPPVLHRDIKPANLKAIDNKAIVLLDFGLAKGKIGQTSDAHRSVAGYTLRYAAPEQIRGEGTESRSDLYAVGATLYHLFTGLHPPDALQRALLLANGKPDPLVFPITEQGRLPPTLTAVLTKAMALEPADRFESANGLRQALQVASAAVATEMVVETKSRPAAVTSTPAKKVPFIRPTSSVWQRSLLWTGGLGIILLVLLGLGQFGAIDRSWIGLPAATITPALRSVTQPNPTEAGATSTATSTPSPTPSATAPLPTTPTVNLDPVAAPMTLITATVTTVLPLAIPTPQPTATPSPTVTATLPQPTATLPPSPTETPTVTPNATQTAAVLSTIVAATLTAIVPTPAATFTPRPIATATLSPTLAATVQPAATATWTPQPPTATATPLALMEADLVGAVTLLEPADNETLGSVDVNFVWQINNPSHPLLQQVADANSEYLFELVVLSDPTQPAQARALVGATKAATVRIKRSGWEQNSWGLTNGQHYYWTIRLGKKSGEHYEALGLLAEPRRFIAQTGGGNDQDSASQPSRKD